ncbi:MAG: response regulator, partial [Candidatus Latescibacteria bacterium]|nr:response regulator [Candidatus Latescibacterota bacterium]
MQQHLQKTVLLVDHSSRSREDKQSGLAQQGYHVIAVDTGDQALNVLETEPVHVLISDVEAPAIDGLHLMQIALRRSAETGVILMTNPGREELVVTAMREGAYDVLEQPVLVEKLEAEIEKILERQRIVQENTDLQRQLGERYGLGSIIGKSASMQKIRDQILQIAD